MVRRQQAADRVVRPRLRSPGHPKFQRSVVAAFWVETVNGYYKTELVRGPARPGPWKTVEDLELATLGWVHWHNTQRLHGYLGDVPPAEFKQAFYADQTDRNQLAGIK